MFHTCSAFHGVCESEGIMLLSVKENKNFCLKHILSLCSNSIYCVTLFQHGLVEPLSFCSSYFCFDYYIVDIR